MQSTKTNYSALTKADKDFYTLSEFADMLNCSIEYVRQMCRGQKDNRGYQSKLPEGWTARKNSSTHMWEIFRIVKTIYNTPQEETPTIPSNININNLMLRIERLEGFKEGVLFVFQNFKGVGV